MRYQVSRVRRNSSLQAAWDTLITRTTGFYVYDLMKEVLIDGTKSDSCHSFRVVVVVLSLLLFCLLRVLLLCYSRVELLYIYISLSL